jgi:hypothetical protein
MKPAKPKKSAPIKTREEVQDNPDKHIDQDFEGYPHHPAKDETINPKTETQKKTADMHPKTKTRK